MYNQTSNLYKLIDKKDTSNFLIKCFNKLFKKHKALTSIISNHISIPVFWFTILFQYSTNLPNSAKIVKVTKTFGLMRHAMIINRLCNPSRFKIIWTSKTRDIVCFQDSEYLDQSWSIRSKLRYLSISAILNYKPTAKPLDIRKVDSSRALSVAHHSFFSLSYPSGRFFFSLMKSHTLAHAGWPTWRRIRPVYTSGFQSTHRTGF